MDWNRLSSYHSSHAVEKGPPASLRSIASLQRIKNTPPLVDFSRASHLDLFEQHGIRIFQ
jgi:hypothetical protein